MTEATAPSVPLHDIIVEVSVELGRSRMGLREMARRLTDGSLIHMGKDAGEYVDIYVNGRLVGRGEAVAVGQRHGVRITEILPSSRDELRRRSRNLMGSLGMPVAEPARPVHSAAEYYDADELSVDSEEEPILIVPPLAAAAPQGPPPSPAQQDVSPPPGLDAAGLLEWAWQHAAQVEIDGPDFQRDHAADGVRFRAAFEHHAGLPPEQLRWMSDDLFCIAGPVGEPPEYHCFTRAHALEGESLLFHHLFDRLPGCL